VGSSPARVYVGWYIKILELFWDQAPADFEVIHSYVHIDSDMLENRLEENYVLYALSENLAFDLLL
jgi:hypothetical protein